MGKKTDLPKVTLRWTNPADGLPVKVTVSAGDTVDLTLDFRAFQGGRSEVTARLSTLLEVVEIQ